MAKTKPWSKIDIERSRHHGLAIDELDRQLELLRTPPPSIILDRPCLLGDGVEQIPESRTQEYLAAHGEAVRAGRTSCFVPASGAASRMFKGLLSVRARGVVDPRTLEAQPDDPDAKMTLAFLRGLDRFAFVEDLAERVRRKGQDFDSRFPPNEANTILEVLLDSGEMAYPARPKGLLLFHRYGSQSRTAFEEHLVEAAAIAAGPDGTARIHMTISPDHREAFTRQSQESRATLAATQSTHFEVDFSVQKSSTDTICATPTGDPFRDDEGDLLFRPGGHGSLLTNLSEMAAGSADLVYVKNIDNVVHDDWREPVLHWRKILAGRLILLQERLFGALRKLDEAPETASSIEEAKSVLRDELGVVLPQRTQDSPEKSTATLRRWLNRPSRVCAVVRAEGDPGGGPFWVRGQEGIPTTQIVETAEIDQSCEEQKAIQAKASHFNPADMVLGLRDYRGEPFALEHYLNPSAVFLAEKSSEGRSLTALEHPGLWNGGMADWNTLFVETPASIFQPVKTVVDLLSAAHQPVETAPH